MSGAAPFPHRMVVHGRQIRHDPELGHAFVAGVHRRVPHERGSYFSVTNAEGFREDHDLASPPPGYHALCYGDSYAAGDGVDNHERFSALLGARLGITVSNVAVPGHGPDQNVLQLESGAMPRADLILWCVAVHTLDRIRQRRRFTIDREGRMSQVGRPHFTLDDAGELQLHGVPVAEHGDEVVEDRIAPIEGVTRARIRAWRARARRRLVDLVGPLLKPDPDPGYRDPDGDSWRLMAALVRRFHAAADGVPVVIVPLPTSRYLCEDREPHFQRRFAELERREHGLHVIDITNGLRAHPRRDRQRFHYRSCGHFTAPGHRAVAEAIAAQLRPRALVPSRPARPEVAGPQRTQGLELHVGWTLDDGWAVLRDERDARGREQREAELCGHPCRAGVLPLSAIHACLDEHRVAGPELSQVVLHSPCPTAVPADERAEDARTIALRSGLVRWHGAAERDLRDFLRFPGAVVHRHETEPRGSTGAGTPTLVDDEEQRWLTRRCDTRFDAGRLARLARAWELATRGARILALPTSAPLRRGRVAARST